MEKFSVKKPFTVLVAVIMVIMLGLVSVQNMQTNLLPNVNTPYLMVVTVYPGASPERVENEVSDVMESALGTISGVKNVTATSAENYSLLLTTDLLINIVPEPFFVDTASYIALVFGISLMQTAFRQSRPSP